MRTIHITSLVLVCLAQVACRANVVERADTERPPAAPVVDAGSDAPPDAGSGGAGGGAGGGGGGGGDRTIELAPDPDDVDDSGTLSVMFSVTAWGPPGQSQDQAQVELSVTVNEWVSGIEVPDADVSGGPLGAPSKLDRDLYSLGGYGGFRTGYNRAWEFSVVRGADHLKGVLIVGPSYQEMGVWPSLGSALVDWSPSQESGVRSLVCAYSKGPNNFAKTCANGQDEGSVILASSEAGAFPASPYEVGLNRSTKVPIGLGGAGIVQVTTLLDVP